MDSNIAAERVNEGLSERCAHLSPFLSGVNRWLGSQQLQRCARQIHRYRLRNGWRWASSRPRISLSSCQHRRFQRGAGV